jgi:hypothetical protein
MKQFGVIKIQSDRIRRCQGHRGQSILAMEDLPRITHRDKIAKQVGEAAGVSTQNILLRYSMSASLKPMLDPAKTGFS